MSVTTTTTKKTKSDYDRERNAIKQNILNNGGGYTQADKALSNYNQTSGNRSLVGSTFNGNSNGTLSGLAKAGITALNNGQKTAPSINGNPGLYGTSYLDYSSWKNKYGGTGLSTISGFTPSSAYTKAMEYTNSLLEQLNSGRTQYSDKIDSLMDTISNRDKFSYDFNTDPLFQNALASAMASGQTAMQDTIGQASSLTGGYGSSYATSAANQAYNQYVQEAYDNLPDYYNIALNAYNSEGEDLYNQLNMYQTADSTAYDRLYNSYSANLSNAQNLYDQEYNNYWDTANYNYNVQKYNADLENDLQSQYASYVANATSNGNSTSTSSTSDSTESTVTTSELNAVKSTLKDYVAKYGADNPIIDKIILQYANQYHLSEEQIADLSTSANGYDTGKTYTVVDAHGYPVAKDQYGNTHQDMKVEFTLSSIPSGKESDDDQATYVDNYGNKYTYAELKARGWTGYIKGSSK